MTNWSILDDNPSWASINNIPSDFVDGKIAFNELTGIPDKLAFLANPSNNPPSWQPWVLSSFYGLYLEWMPLTSSPNPWTMVQRDGSGRLISSNFIATSMPTSPAGLAAGTFYNDNGIVKVVL